MLYLFCFICAINKMLKWEFAVLYVFFTIAIRVVKYLQYCLKYMRWDRNGKWLYIIFSVQWYQIGSWYQPIHKVQVLEQQIGKTIFLFKWALDVLVGGFCDLQTCYATLTGCWTSPSSVQPHVSAFVFFFSQWKWGGNWSVSFHQCFSLAVIYVYILNNKKKQLGHTQLVTQSSIQMSWRCGMTSCLLVPAVHLRREYGTFMMLYDAFYGFIMEFPAAF